MGRNAALDILKLGMAVLVVGLHAFVFRDISEALSWLTVNGLCRIAVPTFLVINGYFFAAQTRSRAEQRRWIVRVAVLYGAWMLVYAPFWLHVQSGPRLLLWTLFWGYRHLWYLAGLIGAALMLMVLRRLGAKLLLASIAALFAIGVIIQYAQLSGLFAADWGRWFDRYQAHRNFLFFSFPFFAIGFLLRRGNLLERISLPAVATISVIGLLLLFAESLAILMQFHPAVDVGVDNLAALIIAAPAIFVLAMKLRVGLAYGKQISLCANGVYFTHMLFIVSAPRLGVNSETAVAAVAIALSLITSVALMQSKAATKWLL